MTSKSKIKFSHEYVKLENPKGPGNATLLSVSTVQLEKLPLGYLDWDTRYIDKEGKNRHYQLPTEGKYLLLLFWAQSQEGFIFTTLRRCTPEKEKYYRSLVGEEIEVLVLAEMAEEMEKIREVKQ